MCYQLLFHLLHINCIVLFSWMEIPSMSLPRLSATAVLDNNDNMWVFGGTYDLQTGMNKGDNIKTFLSWTLYFLFGFHPLVSFKSMLSFN